MKTLLAYASKHGTTRKAAESLAEQLQGEVVIVNLEDKSARKNLKIKDFERIIIGGSIYIGNIQKSVKNFCQKKLEVLLQADQLGIFICCGEEKKALEQLENAFPEEILQKASAKGFFGHEFDLEKINFVSRAILKKAAGVEKSESKINYDNIRQFAEELDKV